MEKTLQKQLKNLPKSPGVYLYRDKDGEALYVGKAVDIRNRVRSYFQDSANLGAKTHHMVERIDSIEHFETESEFTALLLEADLIKRLKPKYNQRFKDDKTYPLIEITKEKFPRISVTRKRKENAEYFGPYPHGNIRKVLRLLRKSFPFRSCSDNKFARYKKLGRGCLFADIELCPAPCVEEMVTERKYKKSLKRLKEFLEGKGFQVINDLETEMTKLSAEEKFEEAAQIRDQLDNLKYIRRGFRTATQEELDINLPEDLQQKDLEALQNALDLPNLPRRIEAYDISNLQGKEATGSMVVFENARPQKEHYRRFKIRMENEPDDVGMLKEVLERRFSRAKSFRNCVETGHAPSLQVKNKNTDSSFQSIPDLILIDGGKGQLNAAIEILQERNLKIPAAALAKREERIYYSKVASFSPGRSASAKHGSSRQKKERGLKSATKQDTKNTQPFIIQRPLTLPKTSLALQLLQRIRDESHRFALAYHRKLRSETLK